jgi:hypothetical protein
MSQDGFRAFEKDGLRTVGTSTHSYSFIVVDYRLKVPIVGDTANRRSSVMTTERRRRYWLFEQRRVGGCVEGAPLILGDEDVPNLHPFKDGVFNQLKLELLLMGNRAAVCSFLNEEAVATRTSTFMTEVLPQIFEMNIMPAVPGRTRDDISTVFRSSSKSLEAAQIVREQIKLLVASGDLNFDEAVVLTSPSPLKSAPKKRRGREGIVAENLFPEEQGTLVEREEGDTPMEVEEEEEEEVARPPEFAAAYWLDAGGRCGGVYFNLLRFCDHTTLPHQSQSPDKRRRLNNSRRGLINRRLFSRLPSVHTKRLKIEETGEKEKQEII